MDRRTFLTGAGTLGGIGAAGTGAVLLNGRAGDARARGLAQAAGAAAPARPGAGSTQASKSRIPDGLTLGYLPGSAAMFGALAGDRQMRLSTIGLRWAAWDGSSAAQAGQTAIQSLLPGDSAVDVSIGILRQADSANAILTAMEIVAHYAIDDAPFFAPFNAWSYQAAGIAKSARRTQAEFA